MTAISLTTTGRPTTALNGSFATSVLTVNSLTGTLHVGDFIFGASVPAGTYITSFGTGVGGTGTYNLSTSPGTIGSAALTTMFGWLVPADWNSANNKIECIGSGADGTTANTGQSKGGGGGGAYASRSNMSFTPGTYVNYQVGTANGGNSTSGLGSTMFQCTSTASAGSSAVGAQGGANTTGGTSGGPALSAGNSTGATVSVASTGGGTGLTAPGGGGGGGAPGGPNGAGAGGGNGAATTGGGGASGDNGSGGAGGSGGGVGTGPTGGAAGTELAGGVGPGGGGGGGSASATFQNGANGAVYGAGGGGGGTNAVTAGNAGSGRQGLIVISYTPAAPAGVAGGQSAIVY